MHNKHTLSFLLFILIAFIIGLFYNFHHQKENRPSLDMKQVESVFLQDQDYHYFYNQLSDGEKNTYQRLYYACYKQYNHMTIEDNDIDRIQSVFEKVLFDHPEFYYVSDQFSYSIDNEKTDFSPEYDYQEKEVKTINQKIKNHTQSFIDKTKTISDPVEKSKAVYDYIIENVVYHENEKTDQNIISSLVEGKSVCAGYARGYQYLANRVGLQAVYMVGMDKEDSSKTDSDEGHAWVMNRIHDDYYYCDPTWGDVDEKGIQHTCYGYFMMDSEEMLRCYQVEVPYEQTKHHEINYFQQQGTYMKVYDEDVLSLAVQKGLKKKNHVAEVKCANERVYQQVKYKLEKAYLGYRLLNKNHCWNKEASYFTHDELRLIELYY
ncbi:MAG: transglutaminase domain-containing protein [Longibaculum sp.]